MSNPELQKLLTILRDSFKDIFGEQFDRMLLYGSYARSEARSDSDIDLLIVLRGKFDYSEMIKRTSEIVARLSLENDVVISRSFVTRKQFEQEESPFLLNVRREGIFL
jgi:predicted nucleotidyltransferase